MLLVREFVLVGVVLLGSIACVLCSSLITKILLPFHNSGFMLYAGLFYARVMRIPLCKSNVHSSPATYCPPLASIANHNHPSHNTHTHTLPNPPVLSYHTHLPLYGRNYLGFIPGIEEFSWGLIRFAHSRADLTLVTSPQMKEEMEANGVPRVEVWRKGIDTVRFHPKYKSEEMRRKMTDGNEGDFLMVYVGRLGGEKRLKDIRPVLEQIPNARLCIVGKGPQEEELKEYFKDTNTVFTGQLSGDELSSAFASADVFMMPSDSETLGFVVLESMASGVPVIGCAAGGIPDLIRDNDTGFLVQPGDTEGYLNCAKAMMDTEFRTEMGVRARAEAEKWGWEAATSVLRNVQYEKCMINFHSRAFGGFGRPNTVSVWRLMRMRVARVLGRLRVPGFRRFANRRVQVE